MQASQTTTVEQIIERLLREEHVSVWHLLRAKAQRSPHMEAIEMRMAPHAFANRSKFLLDVMYVIVLIHMDEEKLQENIRLALQEADGELEHDPKRRHHRHHARPMPGLAPSAPKQSEKDKTSTAAKVAVSSLSIFELLAIMCKWQQHQERHITTLTNNTAFNQAFVEHGINTSLAERASLARDMIFDLMAFHFSLHPNPSPEQHLHTADATAEVTHVRNRLSAHSLLQRAPTQAIRDAIVTRLSEVVINHWVSLVKPQTTAFLAQQPMNMYERSVAAKWMQELNHGKAKRPGLLSRLLNANRPAPDVPTSDGHTGEVDVEAGTHKHRRPSWANTNPLKMDPFDK